jgi:hypothetical protein
MPAIVELLMENDAQFLALLERARELVDDPSQLHESMAQVMVNGGSVIGIQKHITNASRTRHKTADRLGAQRSGYLEQAAQNIEATGTRRGAEVTINNSSGIFARTWGPVRVRVQRGTWLAIPCHKNSYNKSPLNFPGMLDFVKLKEGLAAWFLRDKPKTDTGRAALIGPRKPITATRARKAETTTTKPKRVVYFWGKHEVTLPKDEGLLPADWDLIQLAAEGAQAQIDHEIAELEKAMIA